MMSIYLTAILVAACATFIWRFLGTVIAKRINVHSMLYRWFTHISYSAVMAILIQNLLVSDGRFDNTETLIRLFAIIAGLLFCFMSSQRIFRGLIVATATYGILGYTGIVADYFV